MDASISARRWTRCAGRAIVRLTVSMIQPSTVLMVLQEQSPFISFFTEMGSDLVGRSNLSFGRKTKSIAFIKVLLTLSLFFLP